jgi:hypothetical protein
MKRGLGFVLALGLGLALPATGWAEKPQGKAPQKVQKGPLENVTCALVAYEAPTSRLTVTLSGLPAKKTVYGAAALDKGDEGGVWVQVGQDLKADGQVTFEASDFHGRALVFLAKNGTGKEFLRNAQKGSAQGKPATGKRVRGAAIVPVCNFDLP